MQQTAWSGLLRDFKPQISLIYTDMESATMENKEYIYPDESYAIRGAIYQVYNTMGNGFLEAVYQECMEIECSRRHIPCDSQLELDVMYGDTPLTQKYRADLVCYGKIIVELKAVSKLLPEHRAQLHNYLKATGYKLGFLVNFGAHPSPDIVRVVN